VISYQTFQKITKNTVLYFSKDDAMPELLFRGELIDSNLVHSIAQKVCSPR